jgi:hypothetical protein
VNLESFGEHEGTHFCHDFSDFPEISAPAERTPRQKILDQSHPYVIPHFLELFIDLGVVLVVLNQLYDESAICQRKQFSVLSCGLMEASGDCMTVVYSFLGTALPNVFTDRLVLFARRRHHVRGDV